MIMSKSILTTHLLVLLILIGCNNKEIIMENGLIIEDKLGRVRTKKWGSRIIDIDILFFNQDIINQSNLIIPLPFIQERNFVLIPLNQIASELVHPILQKSIKHIKENCTDKEKVVKYEL